MQSSYDYDTHQIGPYTLPIHIDYVAEYCNGDRFYLYKYYKALLDDEDALAVFNVNNYCLCVVRKNLAYETVLDPLSKLELLQWNFPTEMKTTIFERVGFIKTYQDCLAVSQFPTSLIREINSDKAYEFTDKFDGVPLVNPPYSLYRELVNSEAKAVYYDTVSQTTKFLFK